MSSFRSVDTAPFSLTTTRTLQDVERGDHDVGAPNVEVKPLTFNLNLHRGE